MPSDEREITPEVGGVSRRAGLALTGFFLAVVAVPMLAQPLFERFGWFERVDPETEEIVIDRRLQELDLFRGLTRLDARQTSGNPLLGHIREFETELEKRSVAAQTLRPLIQWLQLSIGNQGNEKVVATEGGWLFYRPGIDVLTRRRAATLRPLRRKEDGAATPIEAVLDYRKQLQSLGIELMVAPVPVKAMIYPEELVPGYDPQAGTPRNSTIDQFYADLAGSGVPVVDLIPEMWRDRHQVGSFQPYDTHWSPEGMELLAEGLARSLRERFPELDLGNARLRAIPIEVTNRGDLADLLDLPSWSGFFPARSIVINQIQDTQGRPVQPNARSPILLLGDSSANIYSSASLKWGEGAGLAEQLSLRLGHIIDWVSVNGGGATEVRRRGASHLRGKKIVVWCFILRDLDLAGGWQLVPSQDPERSSPSMESAIPGNLEVRARILETSEMRLEQPDVYPDTTTHTLFEIIEVLAGESDDTQVVVVEWMMKGGEFLAPFHYYRGDEFRIVLVPLEEAKRENRAIAQAISADDLKKPDLPHYWLAARKQ